MPSQCLTLRFLRLCRLHCWKSHMISQSILTVRGSTVNYCLCMFVQSLSKQNSRTSRRDSSDTGDDRTPGEESVGVCIGQQMAVWHRARLKANTVTHHTLTYPAVLCMWFLSTSLKGWYVTGLHLIYPASHKQNSVDQVSNWKKKVHLLHFF